MTAVVWKYIKGRMVPVKPSRERRFYRRQLIRIFEDAAAHPGTSPRVAKIVYRIVDAIDEVDRYADFPFYTPHCTCYRGMDFIPDDDCPACSYYGAITVGTAT